MRNSEPESVNHLTEAYTESTFDIRAIGSNPVELEKFYRTYIREVERFIARRVPDVHTAADVTSDTFLRALNSCHRFNPDRGTPRTWLLGIAFRAVRDAERQAARRWRAYERHTGRVELQEDAIEQLEAQLDAEAGMRSFRATMSELSKGDRMLLELTALDGLSVTDAAAVIGISSGAARVRLHRARARLQKSRATEFSTESDAAELA